MAYVCPRCGGGVERQVNQTAGVAGGVFGVLFAAAFGDFVCKLCGPLKKSEFSTAVRRKMMLGSVALLLGAVGCLVCVVLIIMYR